MVQLLHLCPSATDDQAIEELASECNVRVKNAATVRQCLEWLELWDFDGFIVRAGYASEEISSLTEQLWSKNEAAPFWVYDFGIDDTSTSSAVRLIGGSLLVGEQGKQELKAQLAALRARGEGEPQFRVMVVEDLDSPRDIICFFLEKFGYHAEGVSSATEALSKLSETPDSYDCIVTDYRMPKVNGEEFIRSVRAREDLQNKPVIVLTAYGTADSLVGCLKAGASGFLLKPPKKADLQREMGRAIRICAGQMSPRLSSSQEADALREILVDKGFV